MKRLIILMLIFGGSFIVVSYLPSCKHEPSSIAKLPTICFEKDIKRILGSSCSKCHSSSNRESEAFDATSYSSIMNAVSPGNPWGSKLYTIISSPNNPNFMPPKGYPPINQTDRTMIELWILQGAQDTKCDSTTVQSLSEKE